VFREHRHRQMPHLSHRAVAATAFLAVVSLIAGTPASWCQADQQPKGLPNFGRVAENLYRGAQPTPEGFNTLRAMGVGIVVNFRENHAETEKEKREVESLGIQYVGIPWSANDEPSNAQIVEFLDLVRAHPNTKIFVHCQRGADRTGVMIAAYRIAVEHKSVAEAVSEMRQYHYDWFWLPHLRRYIESLPESLQKDPQFAAYRPQQPATTR
jgi:tyrosine-protein phosphatase SIW14